MNEPVHADPIPLNCPYCGRRMAETTQTGHTVYRCGLRGQFWIDAEGNLREVPRA